MDQLHYGGQNPSEALSFFKLHRTHLRTLRRVLVAPEGTTVMDINGEGMFLSGLTWGCEALEVLLKLTGASYDPATLHNEPKGPVKTKAFQVVKSDPWGHDRVM
jgi:hypothetical protein